MMQGRKKPQQLSYLALVECAYAAILWYTDLYWIPQWKLPLLGLPVIIHLVLATIDCWGPSLHPFFYLIFLAIDSAVFVAQYFIMQGRWNDPSLDVTFPPDQWYMERVKLVGLMGFWMFTLCKLGSQANCEPKVIYVNPHQTTTGYAAPVMTQRAPWTNHGEFEGVPMKHPGFRQ